MFPKLSHMGHSKSCANVLLTPLSSNTPLRTPMMTPQNINNNIFSQYNNNVNNFNVVSATTNNSFCLNNSYNQNSLNASLPNNSCIGSIGHHSAQTLISPTKLNTSRYASKWIVNKMDNNTNRILSNYKKEPIAAPVSCRGNDEQKPQTEMETPSIKNRRKRMIIKSIDSDFGFPINNSANKEKEQEEVQHRLKLKIPPQSQYQASPVVKKRSVKRTILYVESNSQDFPAADQENTNQSDNNDEMTLSGGSTAKDSNRSRQSSLQGFSLNENSKSQQSIFSSKSSHGNIIKSLFQKNQTSIAVLDSEKELQSTLPTSESEEPYNFTSRRRVKYLPPINKGILKNITSEPTLSISPVNPFFRKTKKQVSFNLMMEFH